MGRQQQQQTNNKHQQHTEDDDHRQATTAGSGGGEADVRRNIAARFKQLTSSAMDPKALNHWTAFIAAGTKSFSDFERMALQSNEYENRVATMFRAACQDVLGGTESFNVRMLDDFMRNRRGQEVFEEDVTGFVKSSEAFRSKYTALTRSVAHLVHDVDCEVSEQVQDFFLDKFRTLLPDYGIDNLNADLSAFVEVTPGGQLVLKDSALQTEQQEEQKDAFTAKNTETFSEGKQPDSPGVSREDKGTEKQQEKTNSNAPLRSVSLSEQDIMSHITSFAARQAASADVGNMLESFREVFGRPMYVQEYLRLIYAPEGVRPSSERETWRDVFSRQKPQTLELVNVIADVYARFLKQRVTDYDVMNAYMPLFIQRPEKERVSDAVTRDIIKTPMYRAAMTEHLCAEYRSMYGEDIAPHDVDCVFEVAQTEAISLVDDRLRECINAYKAQTDLIVDNLYNTYMCVYDRVPDMEELAKYVGMYRSRLGGIAYGASTVKPAVGTTETQQQCTDGGQEETAPAKKRGGRRSVITSESEKEEHQGLILSELNASVENELVSGLEFHDVLKVKIRHRHYEAHDKKSIGSAALYSSLAEALRLIQHMPLSQRSLKSVDEIVTKVVK